MSHQLCKFEEVATASVDPFPGFVEKEAGPLLPAGADDVWADLEVGL